MSDAYDHDFQPLVAKVADVPYETERPTSRLAVTSLVFGILGLTVLPLYGSIVAIATGHAALGQISESGGRLEGRPMAKVGLGLGYFMIVLALIAGLVVAAYLTLGASRMESAQVTTPVPFAAPSERGVKMVNEMEQADYDLIGNYNLNNAEGEIIACYNAGKGRSNPELALLTTRQLVYLKDGKTTSFELKDVTGLKDDEEYRQKYTPNYFDLTNYFIEVTAKKGPRMRIIIQPKMQGSAFYDAIVNALKQAGVTIPKG